MRAEANPLSRNLPPLDDSRPDYNRFGKDADACKNLQVCEVAHKGPSRGAVCFRRLKRRAPCPADGGIKKY